MGTLVSGIDVGHGINKAWIECAKLCMLEKKTSTLKISLSNGKNPKIWCIWAIGRDKTKTKCPQQPFMSNKWNPVRANGAKKV